MKKIKFLRIFLLVLIIVGIGLLLTQKMWVPRVVDMILKSEQDTQADSQTSDWKTYTNTKYRYTFDYPANARVVTYGTSPTSKALVSDTESHVSVFDNNDKVLFDVNASTPNKTNLDYVDQSGNLGSRIINNAKFTELESCKNEECDYYFYASSMPYREFLISLLVDKVSNKEPIFNNVSEKMFTTFNLLP